jgi:hypothetical protein
MARNNAPDVPRFGGRAIPVLILAVLAGVAMLVALLAMNAMSGTLPAAIGDSSPSSEQSSGPARFVSTVPPAQTGTIIEAAAVSLPLAVVAARTLAMTTGSTGSAVDCTLVGMICAVLLTVAALIGFGFGPRMLRHRPVRNGGVLVRRFVTAPRHIYRPSLTVLSISRT